jgi:hypothetical protein
MFLPEHALSFRQQALAPRSYFGGIIHLTSERSPAVPRQDREAKALIEPGA